MVRSKSLGVLACAVVLALSGCGSSTKDSSGPHEKPTAKTSAASGSKTRVVVQDAGAEPRTRLRMTAPAGARQHVTMTMQMDMGMVMNGRSMPANKVPPMQMGMDVRILDNDEDGNITATFGYDRIRVLGTGAVADAMESELAALAKMHGIIRTTDSGELLDAHLDVPDGLTPTIKSIVDSVEQQLGNMMVPLPKVPVGVGASWTVHTESAVGGIKSAIDYTYKLTKIDGSRIDLDGSYIQTMKEQDAELPTMPAGAKTHVYSSRVLGSGRSEVDLASLVPVRSSIQSRGPVHLRIEQGGEKTDLVQRMHLRMELSD